MIVVASKQFISKLEKILNRDNHLEKRVTKTLDLLRKSINYPSLRLHKLKGGDNYSISVNKSIRIVINIKGNKIVLLDIGTHDEVY